MLQAIDNTGATSALVRFDPYGNVRPGSTAAAGIGYTGEWADPVGLVNLRFRAYDPTLGQFLSRDSFGGMSTSPATGNRHSYALGNPLRYSDPTGHFVSTRGVPPQFLDTAPGTPSAQDFGIQPQSPFDWMAGAAQGLFLDTPVNLINGGLDAVTGTYNCVVTAGCAESSAGNLVDGLVTAYQTFNADPARLTGALIIGTGEWVGDRHDAIWSGDGRTAGQAMGDVGSTAALTASSFIPGAVAARLPGLSSSAIRLPAFTSTSISRAVTRLGQPFNNQITIGARALSKRLGDGSPAFAGIAPTTQNAQRLMQDIMANPSRTVYGSTGVTYDVYNAAGQGARFWWNGDFVTFLDESRALR